MDKIKEIVIRYLILVIIAVPNISLLYKILFPITVFPSYFLISLFFKGTVLIGSYINVNNLSLQIIPACLAASAYFLLIILNLSVSLGLKKRIKTLFFSLGSLLILNILRIFLLGSIYIASPKIFEFTHIATWYLLSIIFVVAIWFTTVKLFKIKGLPFADDLKYLYSKTNLK